MFRQIIDFPFNTVQKVSVFGHFFVFIIIVIYWLSDSYVFGIGLESIIQISFLPKFQYQEQSLLPCLFHKRNHNDMD
jgi:hypothetical protein